MRLNTQVIGMTRQLTQTPPPVDAPGPAPLEAPAATTAEPVTAAAVPPLSWATLPAMALKPNTSYTANLATTDGVLGVQLLPGLAPNAVNNFLFLADKGFYSGTPFHRIIPGFMAQTGDPTGTGTGGPGYDLPDDPMPKDVQYMRGIVAMANAGMPNTGGSQFFVMLGDTPLPPTYSVFGYVTSGGDVLDKLDARKVVDNGQGEMSKPAEPIFLEDVEIEEAPVTGTPKPFQVLAG
ncbi:MAG: peptidylprolyl cis-trans isomerase, cyclophilin-type [Thermoleophilia bacterium]|nr:peptidylprolyl cis-trans isomerase, cyclophilin-type [Thermoleophilia bacterium]